MFHLSPEPRFYPELEHFETPAEGRRALKAWRKQLMYRPRFWLAVIGYTVAIGVTVALILVFLRPWFGLSAASFGAIVAGVTSGTGVTAIPWLWRRRCRRFLRAELISRGVPVCLPCGYDLRGQQEPRCPECGTRFDRQLIGAGTNR